MLLRHGEKSRFPFPSGKDAKLTKKGVKQIENLAKKFKDKGITFNKIFTSWYLRTIQSAQIIAAEQRAWEFLEEKIKFAGNILVVAHQIVINMLILKVLSLNLDRLGKIKKDSSGGLKINSNY